MFWGKLARFGVVGLLVTGINYVLYVTLISLGFHYLVATTLGWVIGVVTGFFGNKHWTFGRHNRPNRREAGRFLFVYLVQLGIGSCTLALMIEAAGIDPKPAYFINVAITALISYLFLDRMVFPGGRRVTT